MRIHIVGIEGAGTSALAQLYVSAGHRVSGSDDGDGFYRAQLEALGVGLYQSFDAVHVPADADMVVHSTAFGDDNVEVATAKKRGLTVCSYPEAVAELFNSAMGIAVCGTHGKTTTTAILAEILKGCGKDPRVIVGSQIIGWQGNALTGDGDVMVLEADEYQNKLRYYNPFAVILTSVDYDHPDFFKTPEDYVQAFRDFVARIPVHGFLVACGDNASVRAVVEHAHCTVITYGAQESNDVVVKDGVIRNGKHQFSIDGEVYVMALPGIHNAFNAVAAIIVAKKLNCAPSVIKKNLESFRGTRRRFEVHGVYNDAVLIDDYAHHPEELRATLSAAREIYPNKHITAAFHPHTFTRTKALLTEFAQSFDDADAVIVIDIYGSAREEHGGVHATDLVEKINTTALGNEKAHYVPTIDALAQWAREHLKDNDVFITLGAGDIWKVMDKIENK